MPLSPELDELVRRTRREVAERFASLRMPNAVEAVRTARVTPDGRVLPAPGGLGYTAGAAYDGGATVPQAPRGRVPVGPDELIRRTLFSATPPLVNEVPPPIRVPEMPLPGVAEQQPWPHLPAPVAAAWRVVRGVPTTTATTGAALHPWAVPAATQNPVYAQHAGQMVPRSIPIAADAVVQIPAQVAARAPPSGLGAPVAAHPRPVPAAPPRPFAMLRVALTLVGLRAARTAPSPAALAALTSGWARADVEALHAALRGG